MTLEMFTCIQSVCFVIIMVIVGAMFKLSIDVALHRYPKTTSDNSVYSATQSKTAPPKSASQTSDNGKRCRTLQN